MHPWATPDRDDGADLAACCCRDLRRIGPGSIGAVEPRDLLGLDEPHELAKGRQRTVDRADIRDVHLQPSRAKSL